MQDLEKLISRLDLKYEGISKVNSFIECGDKQGALQEIINHFRNSRKPVYLFDKIDTEKFHDPEIIEEADKICNHIIFGFNMGKDIKWDFNYAVESHNDNEWLWSLNRHNFWVTLARAYSMTNDEKYAREFVRQLKNFVRNCPVEPILYMEEKDITFFRPSWRTIDSGIRIYTAWLPAMVYFKNSPSWDEEGWLCFLNSIHDHAEFLSTHYSNHNNHCSNWLTMEATALFQMGIMFPEFSRSSEWKKLAYRRITHEVRYQFDHEGVHMERTPIYHLTAAGAFLQAYRMAVLNDITVPPYMLPILEKTAEYLMKLVKPDFSTPMIGDADRNCIMDRKADTSVYEGMNLVTDPLDLNEMRAFFRVMAKITGREDFKYFSSCREEGKPPADKCFCLADQGFYIFRTGWEQNDSYFMVTGIRLERGERNAHSHLDAGHIELQVEGQDILVDTGRYVYGNNNWKKWRGYFVSAMAHNTIQVDDFNMGTVPGAPEFVRGDRTFCHKFETTQEYDVLEISHNGYAFMNEPVFHFRRVIYLKPDLWLVDDILTGMGEHKFQLSYNFAPGHLEPVNDKQGAYVYSVDSSTKVSIIPLMTFGLSSKVLIGSTEPMGGWVSNGYGSKLPAPQLIYSKSGSVPVRFVTAILKEGNTIFTQNHPGNENEFNIIVNSGGNNRYVTLNKDYIKIK